MKKEPITKEGLIDLKKNIEKLKNVERPRIVDAIKKAREFGDLRENAEYHAAKEDLYLLEKKIQDIEIKVLNANEIDVRLY
ncbi:MAG TPA: GreA/GreB family elongation factor [Candidatus Azoamicus sp.]